MKHQVWFFLCCLVFLLAEFEPAAGQLVADTVYCKVSSLPLDSASALGAVRLSQTSWFGILSENSTASMEVENLSSMTIEHVIVIVEYLDPSGSVVLRIPFYATSTQQYLSQPPFALPLPQLLDQVLKPGDRVVVVGESPLISSVCPTKGRIIFEQVAFSIGTQESFSSAVNLDVLPDVLPSYFDSTGCLISWPLDVAVKFKIKPSGEAGVVSVEGRTRDQSACLLRELRLWTFTPALRNGTPVASDLDVLLRFHSSDVPRSDDVALQLLQKNASKSLMLVRLVQSEDNPDHWFVLYAGDCCGRVSRSRRLYRQD